MTLTIEIPDDLAALVAAAGVLPVDVNRYAVAGIAAGIQPVDESKPPRRSLREYAGVGAGQPGAIGGDVDAYIRELRGGGDGMIVPTNPLPWDDFIATLTRGMDSPDRQPLSDYAISREAIYEDHP